MCFFPRGVFQLALLFWSFILGAPFVSGFSLSLFLGIDWTLHVVNVNALLINSDSPIMKSCTKERNTSTSPWCHSTWSEFRFEFSTSCSLCLPSSVCLFQESEIIFPVCVCPHMPLCICLLCVCVCLSIVELYVSVYISVTVCFSPYLLNNTESITWGRNEILQKGFTPTDPNRLE